MLWKNLVAAVGKRGQQSLVGQYVHAPGQALGGVGDESHGAVGEDVRSLVTG